MTAEPAIADLEPDRVRIRLGEEPYALPLTSVTEVAELGDITPVPGAPPAVLGIRNLRGQTLPIVDLAAAIGAAPGTPRRIVVVGHERLRAGLAVDQVLDVGPGPGALVDVAAVLGEVAGQ
jgi:purine-binding chemotaxis protein CheW